MTPEHLYISKTKAKEGFDDFYFMSEFDYNYGPTQVDNRPKIIFYYLYLVVEGLIKMI